MTARNSDEIIKTISIHIKPQDNGQYACQLSLSLGESSRENILCYGQTQEHAIAIALEQLADNYRQIAQKQQNQDWDAVEHSESGEPIEKDYHVIVYYERIAQAPSKFEAMLDTMLGNTVVENAQITVIEIAPDRAN
ncbi:MAG: hypothetical protein F6K31_23275 [Symploca sp. SIO2G7]|nr:hypothetical protein [Symploca sp. SIO2G7]